MKRITMLFLALMSLMSCEHDNTAADVKIVSYDFLLRNSAGESLLTEESAYREPIGVFAKVNGDWEPIDFPFADMDRALYEVWNDPNISEPWASIILTTTSYGSTVTETKIQWTETEADYFTFEVYISDNVFSVHSVKVNGTELLQTTLQSGTTLPVLIK